MSVILSILLYLADIFTVYTFWGSIEFTVVAACLIPVAVVICMIISFLGIRPKSIKKLRKSDRAAVESALDELKFSAEQLGESLPKIHVFVNARNYVNAYAVGFNCVVVTMGLIKNYGHDNRVFASVLAHEMGHIKHHDTVFSGLVIVNLIVNSIVLTFSLFGVGIVIVLIFSLFMSVFFSDIITLYVSNAFGKVVGKIIGLLKTLIVAVLWAICAVIFRKQELLADRYAAKELGFAYELVYFLEDISAMDSVDRTFIETLMDTHPSTYTRIKKIEDSTFNNAGSDELSLLR